MKKTIRTYSSPLIDMAEILPESGFALSDETGRDYEDGGDLI